MEVMTALLEQRRREMSEKVARDRQQEVLAVARTGIQKTTCIKSKAPQPPASLQDPAGQPFADVFRVFKIFSKSFVFRMFEIFRVEGMSLYWSLGLEILGVVFSSFFV